MAQAGVEHFFHAVESGAPHFFHFLETPVDAVEARVHVGAELSQARIHGAQASVIEQDADQPVSIVGTVASAIVSIWVSFILPGSRIAAFLSRNFQIQPERRAITFKRCFCAGLAK